MIRLTRQADYGIVLMTCFAGHPDRALLNARDVAAVTSLPLPTVSKVLKALARGGLLNSHRGVKGGYRLARAPRRITVAEIITAVDGPIAVTECLDPGAADCDIEPVCPCRTNWHRINQAVRDALAAIPLSKMGFSPPWQAALTATGKTEV
ncbi:MAG: SUF system Fe-S cluster assembly regulator [Planctomycetota bacterium]